MATLRKLAAERYRVDRIVDGHRDTTLVAATRSWSKHQAILNVNIFERRIQPYSNRIRLGVRLEPVSNNLEIHQQCVGRDIVGT